MYSRAEYACGITVLTSSEADADAFAARIADEARHCGAGFAYLFFSMQTFDAHRLNAAMLKHAPGLEVVGCSTSGEITPEGISEGHALAILLPARNFTVASTTIQNIATSGMDTIVEDVDRVRRELADKTRGRTGQERFAMCLIDGMSFAEEKITAALHWALDDIPLIGGSAGDDLKFEHTVLMSDGKISDGSAIVMLVSTDVPFSIFKTDNFIPTDAKFVVTASDPERRTVIELNASAAAQEYASAVGKDIAELTKSGFASHPVVVKVGGEFYCRAVRGILDDGSLVFACAIDDGVVLTLAEARGMVETTRAKFEEIEKRLGGIDMVFGFDCAYRRVDAENRQVIRKMSELYQQNHVIGFGTFGEQYQSMHLNQTLTGIAFGLQPKEAALPAAAE